MKIFRCAGASRSKVCFKQTVEEFYAAEGARETAVKKEKKKRNLSGNYLFERSNSLQML